ncbi:hypothetical protein DFH11DRAFT_1501731 [Phellopilus nigrolimitatus]|nr:hypothetical protein DFH11DRAFT_1501731 [Phellopilus nigrolimitatus]
MSALVQSATGPAYSTQGRARAPPPPSPARTHTHTHTQVPAVSLNGGGPPPAATPRPPKAAPAPLVEVDSAWGANFWVTLIQPQSQTPFYACPATGQVSWDPPVGNFVLPPSADGEWWELVDETRSIPYYYHTKTNETVWARPDGFVIPLAILQNTALCRRLSVRYSQVLDADATTKLMISNGGDQKQGPQPQPQTQAPHRRSSQSSSTRSASSQGGASPQTPKRTAAPADQYRHAHGLPHHHHGFGHHHHHHTQQLPPIPASPYQTDKEEEEDSAPPSAGAKGKQREREREGESEREKERGLAKDARRSATPSPPAVEAASSRARSPSAPFGPKRGAPPPQSLDAAASRIARATPSPSPAPSPSPISPAGPQAASPPAPARPHTLTISIAPAGPHSPALATAASAPASPWPHFASLSRGTGTGAGAGAGAERGGGLSLPGSLRARASPVSPSPSPSPSLLPSPAPPVPRRSFSANSQGALRTRDIGSPTLDAQATLDLSPVRARAEGRPILLDAKKDSAEGEATRYSTGGRPVLPDDLASEIQQFVQTEFARQYFTTHRTGFIFRRKIPIEKMMLWQKAPLQSPLLVLNRALQKEAVKVFKVIQRIMGDRERDRPAVRQQHSDTHLHAFAASAASLNASSTSLPSVVSGILEEERWLLGAGLTHGELRDEVYCQVVKQLTGNPNPESQFRGWQLLCVLLVTFPPSKNFEAFLHSFINQNTLQTEGRVDIMARYCLQRLSIISKKGPRGKPPTYAEIETASDAAFNPSTFGESIDAIIRLQERTYPQLQVPIILPFLADGILALGGTKSEGIFRIPGDGDSVSELKVRIERGYYNLEGIDDPHVPASLLKLWLRELCDPLVPTELYNDCVACAKDPDACVQMVARLPTINRRVVLFVVSFLQLFLDEKIQGVTKMTGANLALVMAPNLLRCDSESMTVVFTNAPYEQMFVHNLLLHLKCSKVDPGYVPKHGLGSAITPSSMGRGSKARTRRPLR